jgi:hypothetical protein
VLIGVGVGVAHERRRQALAESGRRGADQDVLVAELCRGHASSQHVRQAIGHWIETAGRSDVVDGHAAPTQDLGGLRRLDEDAGRAGIHQNGPRAHQQRVARVGNAFLGRAIGDPDHLDGHGENSAPRIVGQAHRDLAGGAVLLGLHVDVTDGGGVIERGNREQPSRRAAVHRRIRERRRQHHIAGASDGAGQHVVIFLRGGVGEKHVHRDDLGFVGGDGVDGARDHLARPGEAAETRHAGFVDGDDSDIFGHR